MPYELGVVEKSMAKFLFLPIDYEFYLIHYDGSKMCHT